MGLDQGISVWCCSEFDLITIHFRFPPTASAFRSRSTSTPSPFEGGVHVLHVGVVHVVVVMINTIAISTAILIMSLILDPPAVQALQGQVPPVQ